MKKITPFKIRISANDFKEDYKDKEISRLLKENNTLKEQIKGICKTEAETIADRTSYYIAKEQQRIRKKLEEWINSNVSPGGMLFNVQPNEFKKHFAEWLKETKPK